MKFECFVFDEVLILKEEKKIIDNVVQEIFKSKKLIKVMKDSGMKELSFSLILLENLEAKKLNSHFRNKNKIPDILSFPFGEKDGKKNILGDIVVTPKMLKKNYKAIKEGYQKLLVHGLLHLLGFDHVRDSDFKKMNEIEFAIFQELNN
jgi:probable rRNA maturation factor